MTAPTKVLVIVVGGLVLFVLGGLTGRYTVPARVETVHEKVETDYKAQSIAHEALVTQLRKTIQDQSEKRNVKIITRTVKEPDGRQVTEETFTDLTETNLKLETSLNALSSVKHDLKLLEERLSVERLTKVVIAAVRPKNRLGLSAGYDFTTLFGRQANYNLFGVPGLSVQLQYDRHLFAPVWGCLWAQSNGSGGVCIRVEF